MAAPTYDGNGDKRNLPGHQFADKTRGAVHQGDEQGAADSRASGHFKDVDEQRNENKVSGAEKADDNSGCQ